ncbi:MAG: hypothetical protein H6742_19410 [Alphaproteobacteria bacterium]|nr:hypothetical protein [Alphaproteobacteria bacterium]
MNRTALLCVSLLPSLLIGCDDDPAKAIDSGGVGDTDASDTDASDTDTDTDGKTDTDTSATDTDTTDTDGTDTDGTDTDGTDTDTDTDGTDTDTDTDGGDSGDPGDPWFRTPHWTDVLAIGDQQALVTNVDDNAVQRVDLTTGEVLDELVIGGNPSRVAWNPGLDHAAVVHGEDSVTRVDLIDLTDWTRTSVDLELDGEFLPGVDVAYGDDGQVYVLATDPTFSTLLTVFAVDPSTATVSGAWASPDSTHYARLGAADGDLYIGCSRYAVPDSGDELTLVEEYDCTFNQATRTPFSADGDGVLYTTGAESLIEFRRSNGARIQSFGVEDDAVFGCQDHGYMPDDERVVSMSLMFDDQLIQVFDRDTSAELFRDWMPFPSWVESVSYDHQFLIVPPDEERVYVYLYYAFYDDEGTIAWLDIAY